MAQLQIDAETTLKQMNLNTVSMMEKLAPFGAGNPRPVLVASNVELTEAAKAMGAGDRHMTARFTQFGSVMRAVAFGQSDWIEPMNSHKGQFDIAFRPNINEYNGMKSVQLQLLDWRVSRIAAQSPHSPRTSKAESVSSQLAGSEFS